MRKIQSNQIKAFVLSPTPVFQNMVRGCYPDYPEMSIHREGGWGYQISTTQLVDESLRVKYKVITHKLHLPFFGKADKFRV